MAKHVNSIGEVIHHSAEKAGKTVGNAVDDAIKTTTGTYRTVTDSAQQYTNDALGYAKQNPFKAAGIAAAIGFLLGMLIKR